VQPVAASGAGACGHRSIGRLKAAEGTRIDPRHLPVSIKCGHNPADVRVGVPLVMKAPPRRTIYFLGLLAVISLAAVLWWNRPAPSAARAERAWVAELDRDWTRLSLEAWDNAVRFASAELPSDVTAVFPEYKGLRHTKTGRDLIAMLPCAAFDQTAEVPDPRWEGEGFVDCTDGNGATSRRRFEIMLQHDAGTWTLESFRWIND
jgi:hypothetical protein